MMWAGGDVEPDVVDSNVAVNEQDRIRHIDVAQRFANRTILTRR